MTRWSLAAMLMAALIAPSARAAGEPRVEFDRDVLPILAANCFACHTTDHQSQLSPLYLSHVFNGYLGALHGLTKEQVKALHVQQVQKRVQARK